MLLWAAASLCLGATTLVTVRSDAKVVGDVVRLQDVADISGPSGTLGELLLNDTASANGETVVSRASVAVRLQLAGHTPPDVQVTGAERCVVRRVVGKSLEERLTELLQAEYARELEVDPQDVRVRVTTFVRAPDDDPLPSLRAALGPRPGPGVQRATLEIVSRSGRRQIQPAMHVVELRQRLPLARRSLERGETLRADDIQWQTEFVSQATAPAEADLVGRMLSRRIAAGDMLDARQLLPVNATPLKVIQQRQRVECVVLSGPLKVVLPSAEALESGAVGESIRLRNPESGQEFLATVVSSKQVRISLR